MIAVSMRDNGFFNRLPGIDIKISLPAIQAFIGEFNQRHKDIN
jgi:hypothetical protein